MPAVHLTAGGVSVVVADDPATDPHRSPVLLHWGAALGDLTEEDLQAFVAVRRPGVTLSSVDAPRWTGLVPETVRGFSGTPGVEVLREGAGQVVPRWTDWTWQPDPEGGRLELTGRDDEAGWQLRVLLELDAAGLLAVRSTLTNTADRPAHVVALRQVLPVGGHATELLDLTGRSLAERTPQRHPFVQGTFSRSGRHGRPGHDASLVLVAGVPGFGFGHGELWGVHTAWSGDSATYAERTPEGECLLGGGELLGPGEVVLPPGEEYASPWLLGAWSGAGLDDMSARFHAWLRARSPRTRTPRPVPVNTWEAVYFDHDPTTLTRLAGLAAEAGAQRFVLDDGWFTGRTDDTRALGDWTVDDERWPDGLHPLVRVVQDAGLELGLWVEPEMVSPDSRLAREHPDWILRGRDAELPPSWRHQQVLDLQQPEAYAHVRDALLALLGEYPIRYLKWDHNRDLIDAAHDGRPAVHGQTRAFHRLLDELREQHPALEIESCASGGARVDAEVLTRTDRIWASDTHDPVERQRIQRWTSLLVPPEMIGAHVAAPMSHTTGRVHRLGYRAATSLLFSFGLEWDLTGLDALERLSLTGWVALHRRIAPLLPTARVVRADHPDPAVLVHGVVTPDREEAWYVVATVAATATQHPTPVRLPGLEPTFRYRLIDETASADQHGLDWGPTWVTGAGETLPGALLGHAGVRLPALAPETARVLRAVRA